MLVKRRLKTNIKQIGMSQKSPITQAVKIQRLGKDTTKGVLSIHSTQNSIVSEKAIISVYTDLKRSTKGVGLV